MEEKLRELESEMENALGSAGTVEELEQFRIKYLGRSGALTEVLRGLSSVPPEDRPRIGQAANALKKKFEDAFKERSANRGKREAGQERGGLDLTLPGPRFERGSKHPISAVTDEINEIFLGLGFRIAEGPEIESEYYNFTALNIPDDHPSRESFHTYFLDLPASTDTRQARRCPKAQKDYKLLLRSQTSTVQIRVMEKERPPIQVIMPGKVFRPDATDASHSFMFHQTEGLMVDKDIKFSHLKGVIEVFCRQIFGEKTRTRFRPHFFPFTEPSAEVDVSCIICGGKGCRVCGQKGWLEIMGAGMVNPKVFECVGYNPEEWTGFAFGMGIERIAMLKYGITDIRMFFENDVRFIKQF